MDKLDIIKDLLKRIGMPVQQQSQLCSLTILAMANLKKDTLWANASNQWIRIHDVILFIGDNYGVKYAENSRETFRKQAMHAFRTAALIEDNGQATNSPNYRYRITPEFLEVLQEIAEADNGIVEDGVAFTDFVKNHDSLSQIYASKMEMKKMHVKINNQDFTFSTGEHNELQKAIIEEFSPRFAPNSECLYVGDTIKKDLVKNEEKLLELGFKITVHDKMPDVVLYRADKNWIYFIESVTSVGPMDPKRIIEIQNMTEKVTAGKIFITAFLDITAYKKFAASLAWETEVWMADNPSHMIHFNGSRFMGPY